MKILQDSLLDLRHSRTPLRPTVEASPQGKFLVTAAQARSLPKKVQKNCLVILPDFLHYGRLLGSGRFKEFLSTAPNPLSLLMGLNGAGWSALKHPLLAAKQDFWTVAEALTAHDKGVLGANFSGKILLHPYLADLAFSLFRKDFLEIWFQKMGTRNTGLWFHHVPFGLSLLSQWSLAPQILLIPEFHENRQWEWALESAGESAFWEKTALYRTAP